jgi:hypothetical protein
MGLFISHGDPEERFYVYSVIDRGPDFRPAGGYCNHWPLTRDKAERLAAGERAKTYVSEVRIEEATKMLGED